MSPPPGCRRDPAAARPPERRLVPVPGRTLQGLIALGVAGLLLAPQAARGDTASDTRFFDQEARRAFNAGQTEEALRLFLASQRGADNPSNLYNIGLCAELSGHLTLAFSFYRQYLQRDHDDFRELATDRLAQLEGRLALIQVVSDPPGAEVFVDDQDRGSYGRTPLVVAVDPGPRQVLVRRERHDPALLEVAAVRGQTVDVDVSLVAHLGELEAVVRPPGGSLSIRAPEGQVVAEGSADRLVAELPVGSYLVVLERPGWVAPPRTVEVTRGERRRTTLVAARETRFGRLLITSGRVTGEVRVDGVRVGQTPANLPRVAAGTRSVEVSAPDRVSFRTQVEVREGEAVLLRAELPRAD